jgi:hypothetical protein
MRTPSRSDRPATTEAAASSPVASPKRRRFLFSLGAGSAAGVAATALSANAAATVVAPAAAPTDTGAGYRETEHVRDYYRTTKL